MTPIELLTTRRSVKKLGLPAPSAAHIENMLQERKGMHIPIR